MLEEGRALIGDRQWAGADRVLSRAHEKRIDHVSVLSNLGWARLHNPGVDLETRTEEGHDFLLLAEQFDPTDGDGQYYLAQVLVAVGRLEEAEQRAVRALKAIPEDAARKALVRKIKVLSAQAESKAR
jgi:cytochrome c-type biogenesis protein CcmH/NrfG